MLNLKSVFKNVERHGDKMSYGYEAIHSGYWSITGMDYDLITTHRVLLVHPTKHWRRILGYWMIVPYRVLKSSGFVV